MRALCRAHGDDVKLRDICHSRSGDKGTIANVSLIVFDSRHYSHIVQHVTAARVKAHFAGLATGDVWRYELPLIGALNFVVHGIAGGGVTRTLALDAHGKSLSSALLELEIDDCPFAPAASNYRTNDLTN
jgi:hypothetical protein